MDDGSASITYQPGHMPATREGSVEAESAKAERRAILEREARMMRHLLAEKERELAELGGGAG
jgi:hypothetical protein